MNFLTVTLCAVGLFFCWVGYRLMERSLGKVSGQLTGLFLFLLGVACIAAAFLVRGIFPAFV
jgi:hypothetical protein